MLEGGRTIYEFGPFRLDTGRRVLTQDGVPVRVTPKALRLLQVLLQHHPACVSKEQLIAEVWPDSVGTEANLSVNVAALRKVLGETPRDHRYIVTVPLHGYQFVGDVRTLAPSAGDGAGADGVHRIAVLPFGVEGGRVQDEYLGPGLADALAVRLARLPELTVASPWAVERAASAEDPVEAGRRLGVQRVLLGHLHPGPEQIRLTVELVETSGGETVWVEGFQRPWEYLSTLEEEVFEQVAERLGLQASVVERGLGGRLGPKDEEAYSLYLNARFQLARRDPPSLFRAVELLEKSLAREDDVPETLVALGEAFFELWQLGLLQAESVLGRAEEAARRALELDDHLATAHYLLGRICMMHQWDWECARHHLRRALELAPSSAQTLYGMSFFLASQGELDEALRIQQRARDLDPSSLHVRVGLAFLHLFRGEYQEVLREAGPLIELAPGYFMGRLVMGAAWLELGDAQRALEAFEAIVQDVGPVPLAVAYRICCRARLGDRGGALRDLADLDRRRRREFVQPFVIALAHAGLGNFDEAVAWLQRAADERHAYLVYLNVYPFWDPLRNHPGFQALVERMGLPSREARNTE